MSEHSIFSSARWTVISSIIRKLFTFSLFFVLVRVLSKDDIGLFREFSLIIGFASIFSLGSLNYHLIISKEDINSNLKAIFNLMMIGSLITCGVLFVIAPYVSDWYNNEILSKIIRLTTGLLLIENLRKLLTAILQRELKLKQLANAQTVNVIFYCLLTLVVLLFKKNVWVLILGFYSGNIVELLLMLWYAKDTFTKYKSYSGTRNSIQSYLRLNKRFLSVAWLNNVINYFSGNLPILVLGMIFPVASMGVFYLANQIIIIPVIVITTALLQVFFPTFSRKGTGEIANHFFEFNSFILYVAFPLLSLYTLYAYSYIPVFFGTKWAETGDFILLLSFTAAFSLLMTPVSGIPYSMQKPGIELFWSVGSSVLKLIAVLILSTYGFIYSIAGFVLASIISQIAFLFIIRKLLSINHGSHLKKFVLKLMPTVILSFASFILYTWNALWAPPVSTALIILYFIILYMHPGYNLQYVINKALSVNRKNHQQSS